MHPNEKNIATYSRAAVTISAIFASVAVTVLRPDVAPIFSSVAVGAISGYFAISRNADDSTST